MDYFEHRAPCDPTLIGKFRKLIGEEGVEELPAKTIAVAVNLKLISKKSLETVVVDSTVQPKAACHLKGQTGDAIHAILCAAGYNIKWLLRMIRKQGIRLFCLCFRHSD